MAKTDKGQTYTLFYQKKAVPYIPQVCGQVRANSLDPDQMPHSVASDQGLHCLPSFSDFRHIEKRSNGLV